MSAEPLLSVRDLTVSFEGEDGRVVAVKGMSFDVPPQRAVAMVGESGSGKSVTAHALLGLLPSPPARIDGGEVRFGGVDLLKLPERKLRPYRGGKIGLVFQDPTAALNPVYSVGAQLSEAIRLHLPLGRRAVRERALGLLHRVGFPEPEARFGDYPHELSGGMCQRAMIAIALAADAELLVADEPTSALDMLAAAQIVALLADLRRERGLSLLFISHDLGLVAAVADDVVVVYAGEVVERGPARVLLEHAQHPYTRALLASVPPLRRERRRRNQPVRRLPVLAGAPPLLTRGDAGCRFAPRCREVVARCREAAPPLYPVGPLEVRCFLREQPRRAALPPEVAP
ncbi:MAG: ABC transporter ATP-binding protein [Polyangiaceae bacterium]|nr:ABC transporter ATP-binding protein [Polyangiaceae bacterium]